jgi:hypothetical protein
MDMRSARVHLPKKKYCLQLVTSTKSHWPFFGISGEGMLRVEHWNFIFTLHEKNNPQWWWCSGELAFVLLEPHAAE